MKLKDHLRSWLPGGRSRGTMFHELIQRAREGDKRAVEELLIPYLPALSAFVRLRLSRRVARRESAADIVQSVCMDVIEDIASLRAENEKGFRSWLFGVIHNKLRNKENFHRAGRRDVGRELRASFDSAAREETILTIYSHTATPSRDAVAAEEVARIEAAFEELPDSHRDVLLHVGIAGLSYAEAGRLLDRSEDSVRQLVFRARARLATLLDR